VLLRCNVSARTIGIYFGLAFKSGKNFLSFGTKTEKNNGRGLIFFDEQNVFHLMLSECAIDWLKK
jgi:hypothetical protein